MHRTRPKANEDEAAAQNHAKPNRGPKRGPNGRELKREPTHGGEREPTSPLSQTHITDLNRTERQSP